MQKVSNDCLVIEVVIDEKTILSEKKGNFVVVGVFQAETHEVYDIFFRADKQILSFTLALKVLEEG